MAVHFKYPSRRQFLGVITSSELAELIALNTIDPFAGGYRQDVRFGLLASLLVNMWKKKGEKPAKPDDFILFDPDDKTTEHETPQAIMAHLKATTLLMGGTVTKANDGDDC